MPQDYRTAIHYKPFPRLSANVRCLNGSAHLRETERLEEVTCELCLNPETYKEFWFEKQFPKKS